MPAIRKFNEKRGTAAVEFAVVAPVMFLALFVLIEASRVVMVRQAITYSAREGARTASLATTLLASDVDAAVRDHLKAAIPVATDATKVIVTVTPNSLSDIAPDTTVTVNVRTKFSDVTWLPGGWFTKNLEIAAQSNKLRE
jgi:Flp pilus assembly protein TadG